jgi:type I restriction enzyme M protein
MAKKKTTEAAPVEDADTAVGVEQEEATAVEDGTLLDYITGDKVKDTPKEKVRQRIARALFHEYGIPLDYMERDFAVKVKAGDRTKTVKVDIAIFASPRQQGVVRQLSDLRRAVVCRPEPSTGNKGVTKLRDHEQAQEDLATVEAFMRAGENCNWGLWTNGLEFFFLQKAVSRFEVACNPVGDWPAWDESVGSREVVSDARMRRADPDMLRVAFRRSHNYIHGNQGMPKDTAFWQFLYLIFCKMHDETAANGGRRFWAGPKEQFEPAGQQAIRDRVLPLFAEVKQKHKDIFRGNEEIILNPRALAFMVSELARYDLTHTDLDAKGAAYQEIVGSNLKGDRGQFFTPRGVIKLMVRMLDPKPNERLLDPACGTGGFLVAALAHLLGKMRAEAGVRASEDDTQAGKAVLKRFREYARTQVFGADFDEALVRASQMNLVMASNEMGHVYHIDSLEYPAGSLGGSEAARKEIKWGSIDVLTTNPPFGSNIPTDESVRKHFELAHVWERTDDNNFRNTGRLQGNVPPEVLFIERCLEWLKPGGRMGIVLPDGILGNPGDEPIRWWIMQHAWVLASIDIPVECFNVEANVAVLTSLVFLKKKTDAERNREAQVGPSDYPVFMAVAEKVGYDRRGNILYKRKPDGEEIVEMQEEQERITIEGRPVVTTLRRPRKIVDNYLPTIADAYAEFRRQHKEPGA